MGQDFGIYEMEIRAPAETTGDTDPNVTDPSDSVGIDGEGPELLFYLYPRDTAQNREKIRHLAKLGIVEGFDDETFRGNREVSRGEFVKSTVKSVSYTHLDVYKRQFHIRLSVGVIIPSLKP